MTQLASVARLGTFTALAVALACACGGQSFTSNGGEAGTGAGARAGNGQGGSSSHAGTTGSAGRGYAGSSPSGGSSGVSGSGNVGGAVSETCSLPAYTGTCDAYNQSWYHDASTGICRPFVYGGCGGNENRFSSLAECQKACAGGTPNYDACKAPSDCLITGTGCCGLCDGPGLTAHDLLSYNRQYAELLQCGFALDVAPGGGGSAGLGLPIACAPCVAPAPGTGTLQYFVPQCVAGQCAVTDVRTSPATACKADTDCKLRHGVSCCESCGGGDLTAVRNDGSFEKLVCGAGPVACPACAAVPPPGAVAFCDDGGRCAVAYAADAAD